MYRVVNWVVKTFTLAPKFKPGSTLNISLGVRCNITLFFFITRGRQGNYSRKRPAPVTDTFSRSEGIHLFESHTV